MSAIQSPNPQNVLLLAALGIGAYWIMTRKARAGTPVMTPGAGATGNATSQTNPLSLASQFVGAMRGMFGGYQTAPISGGGTSVLTPGAGSRGTDGTMNLPYVPFEDGFAFNTPNSSVYDQLLQQQDTGIVDYGQFF